jgi:beta-glucanase (GH16 family)
VHAFLPSSSLRFAKELLPNVLASRARAGKATLQDGVYHREFASGTKALFDTRTNTGTVAWASRESLYLPANRTTDDAARVMSSYETNFSVIDPAMWTTETGCFSCKAPKDPETVFECTNNTASALRPASIAGGAGLTIVTTRSYGAGYGCTPAPAGGSSGHISSRQPLSFGTVRVKSRYFPGSADQVSTAKGFIGLEDTHPGAGAITITMHGDGGYASGEPPGTNWTRYMQSSCYQHGQSHAKTFSDLGAAVNAAENYNLYEIDWSSTAVTISVNGQVVRRVSGAANIPQKPLYVRLHARSTEYNSMAEGMAFESYIENFSFTPAQE